MTPTPRTCRRLQRPIALLASGDLGRRRAARVRHHLAACGPCRSLQAGLEGLQGLAGAFQMDLEETAALGFRPMGGAIRARLAARQAASAPAPGLAAVLAPVAATLLVGAFLLAGRPDAPARPAPAASQAVTELNVSPSEDTGAAILTLEQKPGRVHRVAVSRRSGDFARAQVFEIQGGRWVDPTPLPEPGQVVFYRVD